MGKKKRRMGEASQLTRQRFHWIYVEMNRPSTFTPSVAPPLLSTVYMPNIHVTPTERTHLSSQAPINTTV